MREQSFIRRIALAGSLALSVLGVAAAGDAVQAMPVAPVLAQGSGAGALTDVQYMDRRRYRGRRAGLYRCGPGARHTHLERKACGYAGPSRTPLYRR